jgi:hypothetical protein
MIRGNLFDTYTVVFGNGERFSLMATNRTMARLMAAELNPSTPIVNIFKTEEWQ